MLTEQQEKDLHSLIKELTEAIESISHGGYNNPLGLEKLSIAIVEGSNSIKEGLIILASAITRK